MQRLKAFRLYISLAALLFVAKPFLGFGTFSRHFHPRQVHTILVKSFTKRKPESLQDADANVESIHKLLINPFAVLLSAISILLLTLFPSIFKKGNKITYEFLSQIRFALLPPERAFILAGKLSI
jgi:hypothetical protein